MTGHLRVLIVEDSEDDTLLLVRKLQHEGYDVVFERVETAEAMKAALEREKWDIILSDYSMPHFSGTAALSLLKEKGLDIPFIIVTGTLRDVQAVAAMKAGAHDYIMKDNLTRLPAAVERELREADVRREKKLADEALREEEEKLRIITASAGDAVMMIDNNGVITFWNKAAEKMFGYTHDEATGRELHKLIVPEKYRQDFVTGFKTFRETGQGRVIGSTLELEGRRKDGTTFFTEHTISSVNIKGKWHAIGVARDITERKKAEEKLNQSYKKLRKTLEDTAFALSFTVEKRDPYIAGHQRRVTVIACAVAAEMGFSEHQVEGIRIAGLLHDIGKIAISSDILSKPGKISAIEFELIKTHVQVGYDILKDIDFPWPIAQMVFQHHERMNGSGYPQGLSNDEILPEARILGVADVVEAMVSHRPYRAALGIDAALEEISQKRGVIYDAGVVDTCIKLFREKGFKFE
jgi:PAS domain S-box-containing protein/putative nucleotidyltransferase with HDIG domain